MTLFEFASRPGQSIFEIALFNPHGEAGGKLASGALIVHSGSRAGTESSQAEFYVAGRGIRRQQGYKGDIPIAWHAAAINELRGL